MIWPDRPYLIFGAASRHDQLIASMAATIGDQHFEPDLRSALERLWGKPGSETHGDVCRRQPATRRHFGL